MAHLVKAEIVYPPFTGFSSIRTWVTQPRHLSRRSGGKRVLLGRWGRTTASAHIRGQGSTFLPTPSSSFAYPSPAHSSSSAQARTSHLDLLQRCPERDASGRSPPSWRATSKSLGRPDTCPKTSRTGFPRRGSFSPPQGPMRGYYSFPLPPRTGFSTPPICLGAHVLLRPGFP